MVAILLLGNVEVLGRFAQTALPPVLLTFAIAVELGWGLARASGLVAEDRRAVTLEVAFQNVALAIGWWCSFPRAAARGLKRGGALDDGAAPALATMTTPGRRFRTFHLRIRR